LEDLRAFSDRDLTKLGVLRSDAVSADVSDRIDSLKGELADLCRVRLPDRQELGIHRRIDRLVAFHEFFDTAECNLVGRHLSASFLKLALFRWNFRQGNLLL